MLLGNAIPGSAVLGGEFLAPVSGPDYYGLGEIESLRKWLEAVAPGTSKPADDKYQLVLKLAVHYGATNCYSDSLLALIRKLAVQLGDVPQPLDSEYDVWRRIAGGVNPSLPAYSDETATLLGKIAAGF